MADLDFKHHVSEIPAGQSLPEPVKRSVGAEVIQTPDLQGAVSNYASNTNWMSSLGSSVAAKASNAIATKLGGELGKNPKGDLGPSLTDFDKTLSESYQTQAQATLGLQANQLITNSNLEMARAPRITQGLIASTNKQVALGLKNIFKNAPAEILPHLENQYGNMMIQQNSQLVQRMIGEQRTDRQNTLDLSSKTNSENAYALQLSGHDLDKNGDSKSALAAEAAVKKSFDSAVGMMDKTPLERKVAIDTVRQSRISAKVTRIGLEKEKEGKLGEFEKELAENPEKYGISATDHATVINNFSQYMASQQALRTSEENLQSQLMYNRIITNPNISGSEWAAFEQSVSPLKAAQMKFHLIQAQNKKQSGEVATNDLIANYSDPRAQANATPEHKNAAFNKSVEYMIQKNPGMTQDQAEMLVASSAGAPPPVYTKTMQNRLWSGDPAQMMAVAKQIDDLQATGNGHALSDLNDSDLALASDISHNNNPADPAWAARVITENKENQDPIVRKNSESALASHIYENTTKNNTSVDDWILGKFNLKGGFFSSGFDSPWLKGKYASDILSVYSQNYINTRRDTVRAESLTQEYVKNNYGKTKINGTSEWTKHPIEKAIGFAEGEGTSSINKDIVRQVSEPMKALKQKYENNESDTYWSIESNVHENKSNTLISKITTPKTERLQFVKHTRNGISTNTETYPLKLVGNSFNWELNVETDHGPMSVFLAAPEIGVHKYTPDVKWIRDDYLGQYHSFPTEKYNAQLKSQLTPSEEGNQ